MGNNVVLHCPRSSVSEYFNYKNAFSIVLFALVDANYNVLQCLLTQDVGEEFFFVFTNTGLYKKLETKTLCLPQPVLLSGREKCVPYFFLGDEAFPLSENLMKLYPEQHPKGSKE
jgi:hypothetical protein